MLAQRPSLGWAAADLCPAGLNVQWDVAEVFAHLFLYQVGRAYCVNGAHAGIPVVTAQGTSIALVMGV